LSALEDDWRNLEEPSSLPVSSQREKTGSRVPPHNIEAEASLLGAMLLSKDAIADALEVTSAEHFYKPSHAHVFDAICGLYAIGEPADPVTVADALDRAGLLEGIGGPGMLLDLQAVTPAITSASSFARIIQEHATLRGLIGAASEMAEIGYSRPEDVPRAVDEAENLVYQLAQGRINDSMGAMRDLLDQTLDAMEERQQGKGLTGVPTGFKRLDQLTSGLQKGNLIIIGARPSVGKTSLGLNIATHIATVSNHPALIFSLEMSRLELTQRILCAEARVDSQKIVNAQMSDDDWVRINKGIGHLDEAPIYIDDNPGVSIMEIRAKARRLKSRIGNLGVIVVDYLQLMTGRSAAESRQVEISEISRGLKLLARDLETPVIGISQLSRSLESRQDKRPMLSDLRESGSIEQDADLVMFIYRDEMYNPESNETGLAEINLAKNRNGPVERVRLAYMPNFTKFADPAWNDESDSARQKTSSINEPGNF